jgi:hypothetical protein
MPSKDIFVSAIQADESLPFELRDKAIGVTNLEERKFDSSYIEFLDGQIALGPRGPEWTEILKRRKEALLPYCDRITWSGNIAGFTVRIDPEKQTVILWEQHEPETKA